VSLKVLAVYFGIAPEAKSDVWSLLAARRQCRFFTAPSLTCATRHRHQPHAGALQGQIDELGEEEQVLREKTSGRVAYMANIVTKLDLAKQGIRIYTCEHESYRDVANEQTATRDHTAETVASELFREWCEDEDFLREYNAARGDLLRHHRAHECMNSGRGVAQWFLKKTFVALDEKRGVNITYK
jgi:hypothetical protein